LSAVSPSELFTESSLTKSKGDCCPPFPQQYPLRQKFLRDIALVEFTRRALGQKY
jgi:hypothetical protein